MVVTNQIKNKSTGILNTEDMKPSINGLTVPYNKMELREAINFDVYSYAVKDDQFSSVVSQAFEQLETMIKIPSIESKIRKRYRETVRHILFNAYLGHCVQLPVQYSRRNVNFSAHKWYGLHQFSYTIFVTTVDVLTYLNIIDGKSGWHDHVKKKGDQSRFWATDILKSKFDEFLTEVVAERLQRDKAVLLRDDDKKDIKLDGTKYEAYNITKLELDTMESNNSIYNEFSKEQEVLLPLNDAIVTYDFLLKLRLWFYKGLIDIYSEEDTDTYITNINNNNINNKYINNNKYYPLLGRFYKKMEHQGIPFNKRKYDKTIKLNKLVVKIKWNYIHRVFNDSSFNYGGRFYGSIILELPNRSKGVEITPLRNRLMINSNETVEIDYKSLHPRILYNKYLNIECPKNVYEGFHDKNKIKYAMLTMLNCTGDERSVIKAIRKKLIDEGYTSSDGIKNDDIKELITFVEDNHPLLVQWIGSGVGLELMRIDSDIMSSILMNLTKNSIYAKPVHDSVIVEKPYADDLEYQMMECYHKYTGWYPVIDVK